MCLWGRDDPYFTWRWRGDELALMGIFNLINKWVFFPKNRGMEYPPKWMVKISWNTLLKWMIWGFFIYFWKHPYYNSANVSLVFLNCWIFATWISMISSISSWKKLKNAQFFELSRLHEWLLFWYATQRSVCIGICSHISACISNISDKVLEILAGGTRNELQITSIIQHICVCCVYIYTWIVWVKWGCPVMRQKKMVQGRTWSHCHHRHPEKPTEKLLKYLPGILSLNQFENIGRNNRANPTVGGFSRGSLPKWPQLQLGRVSKLAKKEGICKCEFHLNSSFAQIFLSKNISTRLANKNLLLSFSCVIMGTYGDPPNATLPKK